MSIPLSAPLSDPLRWFYNFQRAYPTLSLERRVTDELNMGVSPAGSLHLVSAPEWAVRWYDLEARKAPYPRLEVFDDGWSALHSSGLVELLAEHNGESPSIDELAGWLVDAGWVDVTSELHRDAARAAGQ